MDSAREDTADIQTELIEDGLTLDDQVENELAPEQDLSATEFLPVTLNRVVDGDTVHVVDANTQEDLELRLLLIDTPETVHPNKPVEPFGKEASARITDFINSHGQLYIEYDEGDKQDHYGRDLVYLYAEDSLGNKISVQEVLLEEGLARVGYIYEQQRHLERYQAAEQRAKDANLGIWSMPGYVNEGGEGFNSEGLDVVEPAPEWDGSAFNNCSELKEVFPDGVTSDHAAYDSSMDRDGDGRACQS